MVDLWKIIKTRRSVRQFKDRDIPLRYIRKIIEAASFAPSGSNKQNWRFIAVKDKDIKNRMQDAIMSRIEEFGKKMSDEERQELLQHAEYYTFFADAPLVVAVVAKPYISYTAEVLKKYDPNTKYVSSAGAQSVAAAIENMCLAARALGLGSCWMTGPLIARSALEDILGIKSPDELLALVPIGFPLTFPKAPKRLAVDKIMTVI